MELMFVIGMIYIGGPIGILMLLIGAISLWRNKKSGTSGVALIWVFIGLMLVFFAGLMAYDLSKVNFGL